jgi:mRNA interferase MazF
MVKKFDIILVDLNPVKGSEQAGVRPCLVMQNDYANSCSRTYVVAIISSVIKRYPHTCILSPEKETGLLQESRIDFLQVRTVDVSRIIKKLGELPVSLHAECNKKIKTAYGV